MSDTIGIIIVELWAGPFDGERRYVIWNEPITIEYEGEPYTYAPCVPGLFKLVAP